MKIPIWGRFIFLSCSIYCVHSVCSGKRCGECLIPEECTWCKDRNFTKTRCATIGNLTANGCINIVQRKDHNVTLIKNSDFSDGGRGQDSIQIKPQHVSIKLVPNLHLTTFSVSYKIANDFPLDLYFLNDPSPSMKTLQTSLKSLAKNISSGIENLTTDYRFGLGTFMDKAVLPFSRTSPEFLDDPCFHTSNSVCEKLYSYRHRLTLTDDIEAFEKAIDDVNVTANFDKPVGMFDGLIQTMVCGKEIGWREKARRVLVYATDVAFHHGGDGWLAGILEPNDGNCNLDSSGFYTKAHLQDYPSVGQIIQKAKENNINIIFVIGGNYSQKVRHLFYDTMATLLPGETHRAYGLSIDARNILDIVSDNYKRLRETVKLVVNGHSEDLIIKLYTNCKTGGRVPDQTNICSGLTTEKSADFFPFMLSTFTTCPEKRNVSFTIFPEGLEERVQVDIEHVCDCDCQLQPEAELNSDKCSYNGTYECGICNCNPGWVGDNCECDNRGTIEETCGTAKGICNNAGNCTCRKCKCIEGYSGDKCECNDKNCRSYDRLLCGGPDRGQCDCGRCVCNANYTGEACECLKSIAPCQNSNGTICSGNGECVCGRCQCKTGFRGELCDKCISCPGLCKNNKDCAECFAFGTGIYNSTICKQLCTNVRTATSLEVAAPEDQETNATNSFKSCITEDEHKCIINFNVYDSDSGLEVVVKERKRCPPGPPDPVTIGLSISGAIFIVGVLLLVLWKILTMVYDNLEYSRFESEIKNPAWEKSENPIYNNCIHTVHNPMCDTEFYVQDMDDKLIGTIEHT